MDDRCFDLIVPERKTKERIDAFLSNQIPALSRNKIQKLIKEGLITVDGRIVKPNHPVRPFEKIVVLVPKPTPMDVVAEQIGLDVVYEDEHLLVVNKPAGMVVHPACGHSTGTLVNALLAHTIKLSQKEQTIRPGIVHRLDKDTSGLLVVAKDDFVHHALAAQFSAKTAEREYCALVWGKFRKPSGVIETMLSRSLKDRRKISVAGIGKRAVSRYFVEEPFAFLTHLRIVLETGRTHQIRVHMAHIGHPVFGDPVYGGRSRMLIGLNQKETHLAMELLEQIPHQALHAKTLGFVHPVIKEKLRFDSELPETMRDILVRLRVESPLKQ